MKKLVNFAKEMLVLLIVGAMFYGFFIYQESKYIVEKVWPDQIVRVLDAKGQEVHNVDLNEVKYEVVWVAPDHLRK